MRPRWRTCHRRPPSQSAKVAAHRSRRVAFRFHRVETLGLGPGIASVFISLCQPRHRKHVDRRRHRSALYLKRPLSRRRRPAATVFHADDPVNLSRLPACVNIFWTASKKREPCKQRKGGRNREREREKQRERERNREGVVCASLAPVGDGSCGWSDLLRVTLRTPQIREEIEFDQLAAPPPPVSSWRVACFAASRERTIWNAKCREPRFLSSFFRLIDWATWQQNAYRMHSLKKWNVKVARTLTGLFSIIEL